MSRLWSFLIEPRTLSVIGLLALLALLFVGADALRLALWWAAGAAAVVLAVAAAVWLVRRRRERHAAAQFGQALEQQAEAAVQAAPAAKKAEVDALRQRLAEAVKTIKTSRLGQETGAAALYELPWYMVIGNPAAGKSSAIVRSGLKFPFANQTDNILQGIGGTRNCDWFFTNEGILLDTAGRYAVHEEDRHEWFGFLSLLKRHRPKAPINGILIVASVADIAGHRPDFAIGLAKQLRQRVQELTEQLGVFAPVYLVFTKADLIAGFAEFFEDRDPAERQKAWGATLPYDTQGRSDAIAAFDERFDELFAGLKEMSVTRMAMHRGEELPPGVLTFPLEFAALKPALRSFIGTLFEDNPYQHRPIFRGFYFTSSVQEGTSHSRASEKVAQQFALDLKPRTVASVYSQSGFFLKDLFQKVIFADKHLVRQHTTRAQRRWRYAAFAASVVVLGAMLGGWTWSYAGNRQLLANVQADLDKVIKLQKDRLDLQSRIEALEILQDRLEQLQSLREDRPLGLGLGLYQGGEIERKLRAEYFAGVRQVMLAPVAESIESYLTEVNANAASLQPLTRLPASGAAPVKVSAVAGGTYQAASPDSVEDAYNALKTYLMLADRQRLDPGHLADQITRFWRGWLEANRGAMPREQMIRSAERMLSFALTQLGDPTFPQLKTNLTLVDATRENLRRVVRGMPARERVYSEIKSRASTRFAPVTVLRIVGEQDREIVVGSYTVNGAFTRDAWEKYVEDAIKEAAAKELQSTDWVLQTAVRDDLTLEGSPEQIQKALVQMYKTEYVAEWQKFLRGISVPAFGSFDQAVARMNRLGDPQLSPIQKVLETLYRETSWDNPSVVNERLAGAQRGVVEWFRQSILRQAPSRVEVNVKVSADQAGIPMGPIGKEFAGITRLMAPRHDGEPLARTYLQHLARIRTRFNQIKNQGDPGPASRTLMAQTLEGNGSDLAEALRFVDEQMLTGLPDGAKTALRPLLVRPLMQAFAVLVPPAEAEINRVWTAQVYEPFQRSLAAKYPFDTASKVEAAPAEIAKIFGPDGAIARFSNDTLGALVVRRGDQITPRQWAEMGVRLQPEFTGAFHAWVVPVGGGAAGGAAGGGAAAAAQTRFQIQPTPAQGLAEYSLDIDGQTLRYRNAAPAWTDFTWPGPQAGAGVRISGVKYDGSSVEFLSEPGGFGLERMVAAAQRRRIDPSTFELTWPKGETAVTVRLRIVSTPAQVGAAGPAAEAASGANGLRGVRLPATVALASAWEEHGAAHAGTATEAKP